MRVERYFIHGKLVEAWACTKPFQEIGPIPTLALARETCDQLNRNSRAYQWRVVDAEGVEV